jgi:hypothetical protein
MSTKLSDPTLSAADVLEVVEDLAAKGSRGFQASYVAKRLTKSVGPVAHFLLEMVNDGRLLLRFDLICPDNGRTLETFSLEQDLPIGQLRSYADDEPFEVRQEDIWVSYIPTDTFKLAVQQKRENAVPIINQIGI